MATSFPTGLDELVNPQSTDSVKEVSHAAQHANANDAIEALEQKVGVNNSTDPNSLDYKVKQLELNFQDPEEIKDLAASLLNHTDHQNITATWNQIADRIILDVSQVPAAGYSAQVKHTVKAGQALTIGQPVYISGATGNNMIVSPASYSSESTSSKTLGLLEQSLATNAIGFVVSEGLLSGLDTSMAAAGDPVWLGPTGTLIYGLANKPVAPNHLVFIGIVTRSQSQNGQIFVKIQNGFELQELHNVLITAPATGEVLIYNATTGLWTNTNTMASKTYVDTAVSGLSNTSAATYIPLSLMGTADGVAELDENGFVPQAQLDIDERIQDKAAKLITDGTHYNITVSYDDTAAKLSLSANYDDSEVVSAIATALTAGNGILKTYNQTPPNYIGDYDNGYSYALNDIVSIPTGSPYGIVGSYFIRTGNPLNPGYPPEPGGAPNASWTLYNFSKTITVAVDTSVIADRTYVNTAISNLIDGAPALLDTLNEIAAAIGDDANFITTITNALATKLNITDAANTYLALVDTDERIQDVVGGMVSGNTESTGLAVTYDDPTGKINFAITTADLPGFTEAAQDAAGALFAHSNHTNVTATYDDVNNRVNLSVTAQLTQEQAQDYIAPLFTHGLNPNITATYDDVANKLILETIIPPSKAIMSATAPASPADGEFWFDTDEYRSGNTRALKVWNALATTWEYVSSNLSLSTTNTWTSKNTFTNGVIIGLDGPPADPVHGQIYYNKPLDKLKVWDGLLWQDIQGSGVGGGGLTLIPTDVTAPPSTFFVGLVAPPTGATANGDLWIDVDDIDTPFNQFYTGGVAPDPQQYEFWVDNVEPIQELIYSADEPATPSYEGELWIDTDEYDGSILEFGTEPPNPNNVQLWVDLNENETPTYYKDLTFTNYATQADFPTNAPNGYVAADASTGLAYVRSQGQWLAIVTANNINSIITSNSTVFEDLKALAWMGFE